MKAIKAGFEIIDELNGSELLKKIELCGRVCYKSENKIKEGGIAGGDAWEDGNVFYN